jgi:hypothetical protein
MDRSLSRPHGVVKRPLPLLGIELPPCPVRNLVTTLTELSHLSDADVMQYDSYTQQTKLTLEHMYRTVFQSLHSSTLTAEDRDNWFSHWRSKDYYYYYFSLSFPSCYSALWVARSMRGRDEKVIQDFGRKTWREQTAWENRIWLDIREIGWEMAGSYYLLKKNPAPRT